MTNLITFSAPFPGAISSIPDKKIYPGNHMGAIQVPRLHPWTGTQYLLNDIEITVKHHLSWIVHVTTCPNRPVFLGAEPIKGETDGYIWICFWVQPDHDLSDALKQFTDLALTKPPIHFYGFS